MKEDYVSFELAKKLKEKGFDWETRELYEKNILCCRYENYPKPTISQVLKWLREKKIYVLVEFIDKSWMFDLQCLKTGFVVETDVYSYKTYEEAAVAGIRRVLDNFV